MIKIFEELVLRHYYLLGFFYITYFNKFYAMLLPWKMAVTMIEWVSIHLFITISLGYFKPHLEPRQQTTLDRSFDLNGNNIDR